MASMVSWGLGAGDMAAMVRGQWDGDAYVVTDVVPIDMSDAEYRAHKAWNREMDRRCSMLMRLMLARSADRPLAPLLGGSLLVTEDLIPRRGWVTEEAAESAEAERREAMESMSPEELAAAVESSGGKVAL